MISPPWLNQGLYISNILTARSLEHCMDAVTDTTHIAKGNSLLKRDRFD